MGEAYKSPIAVSIAVMAETEKRENGRNAEWGISEAGDVDLEAVEGVRGTERYHIKAIGVDALLFSEETDGTNAWQPKDGQIDSVTVAVFVYNGMEYCYTGAISHRTMKEFLETLY